VGTVGTGGCAGAQCKVKNTVDAFDERRLLITVEIRLCTTRGIRGLRVRPAETAAVGRRSRSSGPFLRRDIASPML
jgi:hypothetical protein